MSRLLVNVMDSADLTKRIEEARARFAALPPLEKAIAILEQKRSLCIGLSDFDTPRERIERELDSLPEFIVLAELKRLRALHPNS